MLIDLLLGGFCVFLLFKLRRQQKEINGVLKCLELGNACFGQLLAIFEGEVARRKSAGKKEWTN